jgi:hypothetical protein
VAAGVGQVLLVVLLGLRHMQAMAALGLFLLLLVPLFSTLAEVAEVVTVVLELAAVRALETVGQLQLLEHRLRQIPGAAAERLKAVPEQAAPASLSFVTQQTLTPRHQ